MLTVLFVDATERVGEACPAVRDGKVALMHAVGDAISFVFALFDRPFVAVLGCLVAVYCVGFVKDVAAFVGSIGIHRRTRPHTAPPARMDVTVSRPVALRQNIGRGLAIHGHNVNTADLSLIHI